MRNRKLKLEAIKKDLIVMYESLPCEFINDGRFLIHLEFFITCLDYDLKVTKKEIESIRAEILENIKINMEYKYE